MANVIESPLERFPGTLTLPDWLTPDQVVEWVERANNLPEALKGRPWMYEEFYSRAHAFDLKLTFKGEPLAIDPAVPEYPAVVARWVVEETAALFGEVLDPKG